jgi:hypothetical protein
MVFQTVAQTAIKPPKIRYTPEQDVKLGREAWPKRPTRGSKQLPVPIRSCVSPASSGRCGFPSARRSARRSSTRGLSEAAN